MTERHRTFPKSVQPGIPRLGALKSGWRRVTIGSLFDVVERPVNLVDDQAYDLVTVKRARGGLERRSTLLGSQIAVKSQYEIREDDFLISKRQIVHGACAVVTKEFEGSIVSNEYSILRCRDGLFLPFLKYLMHSVYFQQTCFHSSIGVHVEKLIFKLDDWFKWKIDVPADPSDQRYLATFFTAVDGKLDAFRTKEAALRRFKRGLMQSLFSRQLRFTRDDGSPFPNWEEKRLGDVFAERVERSNPDAELLSVTMKSGVVRAAEIDRANGASADRSNYKTVCEGDIAYNTMRMWQGASGLSPWNGIVSPAYTVIIPAPGEVGEFWAQYFKWPRLVHSFERYSQGLTSDTWNLKFPAFASIKLWVPGQDEQLKIADALLDMDHKIGRVFDAIDRIESYRQGLLQQMLG